MEEYKHDIPTVEGEDNVVHGRSRYNTNKRKITQHKPTRGWKVPAVQRTRHFDSSNNWLWRDTTNLGMDTD
jgi:hypothetical protein